MAIALPDPPPMLERPSDEEISQTRRRAVQRGGVALNLNHSGRSTVFRRSSGSTYREDLAGCGHVAQFTLPIKDGSKAGNGVKLCAVCDAGVDWPSLQESA